MSGNERNDERKVEEQYITQISDIVCHVWHYEHTVYTAVKFPKTPATYVPILDN